MFPSSRTSALAQRALDALRLTRSFLLLEDDHDVDWEVDTGESSTRGPPGGGPDVCEETGGVLLSQALASQVPSALRGLTALFGMGRGVSPSPKPPENGERPRPHGPSKLHSATRVPH